MSYSEESAAPPRENPLLPTPESGAALLRPEPKPAEEKEKNKKPPVTVGKQIHKWGTYLGVDWIFNTASGVGFGYWGNFSETGKRCWSQPITNGFKKGLSPFIRDEQQLLKSARYGNMFMSIIAGGMFTIPPLLVLENKQVQRAVTRFADTHIYGEQALEEDPKIQAAYAAIDNAPKKDFTSGMISRFAALTPLLAIVLIPATKRASNKIWFDHVEHASDVVARKIGYSPASFKNLPPEEAQKRWKFIHEAVAMDFGLGIPYAVMHSYFYNKTVDLLNKKEPQAKAAPDTQLTQPTLQPNALMQEARGV